MKNLVGWVYGLGLSLTPAAALAEGVGGGYRGIATIYFTFITVVLIFGAYDVIGPTTYRRKAMMVIAPLIAIAMYLMLPKE